ncbi:MAG TPA: hypothetical protein VMW68_00060, partial [Methyloceanibacter sp.]|nr:hypothetical protein [Methyloceanibacter sp.]HUU65727.1 hypothetical protein [Methyloceanibacter sp.]
GVSAPQALAAEGDAPEADVVGKASSPSPKSPIHVDIVDYQKAEEGPGTFKLSGTAIAGKDVYIYLDEKPIAQVPAAEGDGAWSAEEKVEIDDKVHVVRVEQLDEVTNMMAARAQFSISLSPPSPEDLAAPPPGRR